MLERLSRKISEKIALNTGADEQRRQVIQYGVMAMVSIAAFLLVIVILGFCFDCLAPILTVCLSAALFRQNSGGAHAHNSLFCTLIGCAVCLLLSLGCKYLAALDVPAWIYAALFAAAFGCAAAAVIILVPVDSPAKPIKTEKKKKRMKRLSFITLAVYAAVTAAYLLLSKASAGAMVFLMSVCIGVLWQTFTLTKIGARVMESLQKPLINLESKLKL